METREGRRRWLLALLFPLAFLVRVVGVNWDDGHHYHPDERRIAQAVLDISFQPLQLNPHFFAYGSFPFYVTKAVSSLVGHVNQWLTGYDGVIRIARILGAAWGAATVVLLALLGIRLYGRKVGLFAGALLGGVVLHVQNCHYGTNDIPLTFLVLLTLLLLVQYVQTGSVVSAGAAGLVLGLAVATKFSALPLLLPLGLAVLFRWHADRSPWKPLATGFIAALLAGAGFFLGQPYAILDFTAWIHDIKEQSAMVRSAGLLPYTNQYVGVPKYLYDLEQLVLWGMGPLLGVAALWGTARRLRRVRSLTAPEWILISWVVPFFLVTGSFDVKFPRYLLPIYPLLLLWGAKALMEWAEASFLGRLARGAVVAASAAYLLAFLTIYTRPFTIVTASEWVYANIQPGAKILSQDWDEGFPFFLPDRPPDRYQIVNLPYYEPDGVAKGKRIASELATADYVALQTKRLYGATTQAHEKFPLTSNYFFQLFAGDLGYTLVKDFAARPSLLGIELPDELADESFTVYDHPKAVIFRNTGHLTAAKLEERILRGRPSRPFSRRQMLLARAGAASAAPEAAPALGKSGAGRTRGGLPAVLLTFLLVEALGLAAYALLRPVLSPRPGLYALSKVLGVLFFAYLAWITASLGWMSFSPGALRFVAVAFVAIGVWAYRRRPFELPWKEIRGTELLVWGTFFFFLGARAFTPEIYWGEKPMDFSFLNALYRTTTLPPPEPWLAGSLLSYTYFGHMLVAAVGKCLAIHPGVMFNVGIALTAALAAASAFAAGTVLGRSWGVGAASVFLTLFMGNLAGVREAMARRVFNFDYFWATSRVIRDTINEFPFWSFLFADLHAHVLVIPFTVGFVCLLLMWLTRREAAVDSHVPASPFATPVLIALLALMLGTVMVTNGWSTPTYVVLSIFLLGLGFLVRREWNGFVGFLVGGLTRVILPTAVIVLGGVLLYRPFWKHFTPPERNLGWERGPFAHPGDYLTIHGVFLVLIVPFFFLMWRRVLAPGDAPLSRLQKLFMGAVAFGLFLTLFDLKATVAEMSIQQAVSVRGFALGLSVLGLALVFRRDLPARYRLPVALATFALTVTAGCEFIFVWDRMNTIFKFYLEAWLLLSLAAAVVLRDLVRGLLGKPLVKLVWRGVVFAALAIGLFTAATGAYGILTLRRVPGPRFTLDGTAYLASFTPADRSAYEWLAENAQGIPVLCEAWGPSYQEFSRVSMNTGLPIVLGWEYHVFQRGHTRAEIERRKADVETIYTSPRKEDVASALTRYHVSLVYVGVLERQHYQGGNLANFRKWTDLVTPVYENPGVVIFAVSGAFSGGIPVTTIERVIEETGPAGGGEGEKEKVVQDPAGKLKQPRGIAVDSEGSLYVCDFGNNRIQKIDKDGMAVSSWGKRGKMPGEFQDPCGVAIGPGDSVYVADTWNGRVQVFDAQGNQLREWGGDFFGPRGIAVDQTGSVYLVDTGNHRVVRFSPEGKKEIVLGGKGKEPGKLFEPVGAAVGDDGRVYVCDNGNARISVFDRDGGFVKAFPVPGWQSKVYSEPYATFDDRRRLWVTVPLEHEVRAYGEDGTLLRTIKASELPPGTLDKPIGIAWLADAQKLVVSDIENRLVRLDR